MWPSRWDLRTTSSASALASDLQHSSLSFTPFSRKKCAFAVRQSLGRWRGSVPAGCVAGGSCCLSSSGSPRERQPLAQHSSSWAAAARWGQPWNVSLNFSICPVHLELGLPVTPAVARQLFRHLTVVCWGRFLDSALTMGGSPRCTPLSAAAPPSSAVGRCEVGHLRHLV